MLQGKTVAAIIVAAGTSSRMGFDKLFYFINGVEVLRRSVQAFDTHPAIDSLVVVAGENMARVRLLLEAYPPQKPFCVVRGGACRAASVAQGVAVCSTADLIAIHDGARPFVSEEVITRTLHAALADGAAAPALPVKDTVKQVVGNCVKTTLNRENLRRVQTPQIFDRAAYLAALAAVLPEDYAGITDDCTVMEQAGHGVRLVPGDEANHKVTTPADLPKSGPENAAPPIRVGHGYDVHKLVEGRPLILGGVHIPHEKGLLGHSDADVLLHAISDALLGAAALGDLGKHFPDTDAAFKNADSLVLLEKVAQLLHGAGHFINNVDATILCQKPKLAPHIAAMRGTIAAALGVAVSAVSVKATTEEGLGFTGAGQGVAAHCVVLISGRR